MILLGFVLWPDKNVCFGFFQAVVLFLTCTLVLSFCLFERGFEGFYFCFFLSPLFEVQFCSERVNGCAHHYRVNVSVRWNTAGALSLSYHGRATGSTKSCLVDLHMVLVAWNFNYHYFIRLFIYMQVKKVKFKRMLLAVPEGVGFFFCPYIESQL